MANVLFGVVTDNVDEEGLGRVQVKLNDHGEDVILPWVRVVQQMASADFGLVWLPEIDDNVVVLCGPGGVDGMLVLGALYSGNRKPPGEAKVEHKHLLTPGGNEILIDDTEGSELIKIATKESAIEILLDNATPGITITAGSEITVTSDDTVTVESSDVTISGSSSVTVGSDSDVTIDGSNVAIKGSSVKITGAVELG